MSPLFVVESITLQCTWVVRTYHKNQGAQKALHTNVCKHAVSCGGWVCHGKEC